MSDIAKLFKHRSGKSATLFSTLGDLGRGAGGLAMAAKKGAEARHAKPKSRAVVRAVAKKAVLGKIPHAKIATSVNKVGSAKLGHGALCHMNRIKKMEGSRHGGEGLKRVAHMK